MEPKTKITICISRGIRTCVVLAQGQGNMLVRRTEHWNFKMNIRSVKLEPKNENSDPSKWIQKRKSQFNLSGHHNLCCFGSRSSQHASPSNWTLKFQNEHSIRQTGTKNQNIDPSKWSQHESHNLNFSGHQNLCCFGLRSRQHASPSNWTLKIQNWTFDPSNWDQK